MAENDFVVWSGGANANVVTQPAYLSLTNLTSGVTAGKASAQQANKTWRQGSVMASMIGQFIADTLGVAVIDDGTIVTIEANFVAAIKQVTTLNNTGVTPGTYGPTIALTVEADGRITSLQNANLQGTGLTPGTYVAPTITVGSDGRVDGITSVAYGPLASANSWSAMNTFAQGLQITGFDTGVLGTGMQMRAIQGQYGAGFRNDGTSALLLQTAAGQQGAAWNSYRPFYWALASGAVTIDGTGAGAFFGGNATLKNGQFLAGNDSVGTTHVVAGISTDNWSQVTCGPAGWRVLNAGGTESFFQTDNGGTITVNGNIQANGLTYFLAATFGDNFYAGSTNGQPVIGFWPNHFIFYNAADPAIGITHGSYGTGFYDTGQIQSNGYLELTGYFLSTIGLYGYLQSNASAPAGFSDIDNAVALSIYCPNGAIMGTTIVASSDARVKSDVQPLPGDEGVGFVQSLDPKSFIKDGRLTTGFLAQDVIRAGFAHMISAHAHDHPALADEQIADDGLVSPAGAMLALDHHQILAYHQAALRNALDEIASLKREFAEFRRAHG